MRGGWLALSIVTGAFLVVGCNNHTDKMGALGGGEFAFIKGRIIDTKCIRCHNAASADGGVDLSSHSAMLRNSIVVPFKPEESRFYIAIGDKGSMPKGGAKLSKADVARVGAWITKGAAEKDKPAEPPVPVIPEPNWTWLNTNVFKPRCLSCHSKHIGEDGKPKDPEGDVSFESLRKLKDSLGTKFSPIDLGNDPDASGIYIKTDPEFEKPMPPKPPFLSKEVRKAIFDWITNGAKER